MGVIIYIVFYAIGMIIGFGVFWLIQFTIPEVLARLKIRIEERKNKKILEDRVKEYYRI